MIRKRGGPALLIFTATFCGLSYGQTSEHPFGENFRERCRKLVSGTYADRWNEANRARDAATLAQKSLKNLLPLQDKLEKELAAVQTKLRSEHYDATQMQKRDALVAQVKVTHEQIQTQEELLAKASLAQKTAENQHAKISDTVEKLFAVSFVDDPEGRPRKIFHELSWKTSCPKYRTLCPLSAKEAEWLRKLAKELQDTEGDCTKYASIK